MEPVANPVLIKYPNPRFNAFLMMRFRDTSQNEEIKSSLKEAFNNYGITLHRADDLTYFPDNLWSNIKAYMDACNYGIAVFEQIDDQSINANVCIELGYMLGEGKPILILKEKSLINLPTDLVGYLYKPFDSNGISETIKPKIHEYLKDMRIAKSAGEKLVLFVSHGGTCRCAMAKVVTEQALKKRALPYRLRIESIAYHFGNTNEASRGAREAITNCYGGDLLKEHRVTRINPGFINDADLIIPMEESLRRGIEIKYFQGESNPNIFNFNDFFGIPGDVINPWPGPDDTNETIQKKYRECLSHIKTTIEANIDRIIRQLNQ